MLFRAALVGAAIVMAAIGSPSSANAVPALTVSADDVVMGQLTFPESPPCDYRSKRTGECVEGVDDNPVGATAECGDGLYSHSVTRSGTCSHHDGVAECCPCDPSHSTLAGAAPSPTDADQHFLSLVSAIPGMTITDPSALTASARQVCVDLQDGDETRPDVIAKTIRNTPNRTVGGATALLNAAITAYCPQFGG
jgi:Protein of unknown function (DUF732)/Protein of unknown function (DUF3761)